MRSPDSYKISLHYNQFERVFERADTHLLILTQDHLERQLAFIQKHPEIRFTCTLDYKTPIGREYYPLLLEILYQDINCKKFGVYVNAIRQNCDPAHLTALSWFWNTVVDYRMKVRISQRVYKEYL